MQEKNKGQKEKGLQEYGIIYVSGTINESTAECVCKEIIECNIKAEVNQIQVIINSPGGSCPAGFSVIDIIEWSRIPIYTTGIGMIASMALLIFMTGEKGHRVITPRTSILSHRYSAFSFGNHSQLIAGRKEQDLEHERIINHYLSYSGIKSREELERFLLKDVDTWLMPEEAIQYGLADVIEPLGKNRTA